MRVRIRAVFIAAVLLLPTNAVGQPAPALRGIGPDPHPFDFVDGDDIRIHSAPAGAFDHARRRQRQTDDTAMYAAHAETKAAAYEKNRSPAAANELLLALEYLARAHLKVRAYRSVLAVADRWQALCAAHGFDGRGAPCGSGTMHEMRGEAHAMLGDVHAANAGYRRAEELNTRAGLTQAWASAVRTSWVALKAGDDGRSVAAAARAVAEAESDARFTPDGEIPVRIHAWSLNWLGDAHRAAGHRTAAAAAYERALKALRQLDRHLPPLDTLAHRLRLRGPHPARPQRIDDVLFVVDPSAARLYVAKVKVRRGIAWTLRRAATVAHPAQAAALNAETAAIDGMLRGFDPGPAATDDYVAYLPVIAGDARRALGDRTSALAAYDTVLRIHAALKSATPADKHEHARTVADLRRTEAQLLLRKALVLSERGAGSAAKQVFAEGFARIRTLHREAPWRLDYTTDLKWAEEIAAEIR